MAAVHGVRTTYEAAATVRVGWRNLDLPITETGGLPIYGSTFNKSPSTEASGPEAPIRMWLERLEFVSKRPAKPHGGLRRKASGIPRVSARGRTGATEERLLSAGVTRRRVIVEKSSDGRNRWKPDDYRMLNVMEYREDTPVGSQIGMGHDHDRSVLHARRGTGVRRMKAMSPAIEGWVVRGLL
ncbi:hypothetical protein BC826DRAFT_972740 [Russula brevipes]|nr:hypothetical protein BC826DRAFT_972740 [Russula brevipes]